MGDIVQQITTFTSDMDKAVASMKKKSGQIKKQIDDEKEIIKTERRRLKKEIEDAITKQNIELNESEAKKLENLYTVNETHYEFVCPE